MKNQKKIPVAIIAVESTASVINFYARAKLEKHFSIRLRDYDTLLWPILLS